VNLVRPRYDKYLANPGGMEIYRLVSKWFMLEAPRGMCGEHRSTLQGKRQKVNSLHMLLLDGVRTLIMVRGTYAQSY
jgi:hypothetical protein